MHYRNTIQNVGCLCKYRIILGLKSPVAQRSGANFNPFKVGWGLGVWPFLCAVTWIYYWKRPTLSQQSRQSTKLSFQSSEGWARPPPHTRRVYPPHCILYPPPFGSVGGGAHSLAGEGAGAQFQRGDRHWGTLGIYVLSGFHPTSPVRLHTSRLYFLHRLRSKIKTDARKVLW